MAALSSCLIVGAASAEKRVIVLGFDGLDYDMMKTMIAAGRAPNFEKLAMTGTFDKLGTSIPPQSPVAWSNVITGMDSGGHGIFDFIHRDPKTLQPYLSTSKATDPEKFFKIGKYQIPLDGGKIELLRHGTPFWEVLEDHGIECTIVRMPANFPPSGTATRELSGMGTPDIQGTSGTFSFFTSDRTKFAGKRIGGGKVYPVRVRNNVVKASLHGPPNPFLQMEADSEQVFTVYLDPTEPVAKIVMGGDKKGFVAKAIDAIFGSERSEILLAEGEWSDWVSVELPLIPTQHVPVICRFYLRQVRPTFELYVTPLDIDPMNPALPISTPKSYAKHLAEATGRFYTEEMPEDTKALTEEVFTVEEFVRQSKMPGGEVVAQYPFVLSEFDHGFLFYYFGNQDQIGHMMWGRMDPGHPAYDPSVDVNYADVIPEVIEGLDTIVGMTLDALDADDTLIVMSDHGFSSWRRSMHLNAWLRDNGYLAVKDPDKADDGFLLNIDWSRTKAYGVGLNGLYINLRGREKYGIVDPQERRALMDEIAAKLLDAVDPGTGDRAVTKAYIAEDTFTSTEYLDVGPDMLVGYAKEMRCSNESAMGAVPNEVFSDNTEEWNGDHCMDHEVVPGVLFTNRPLAKPAPSLQNLASAILAEFGVDGFPGDVKDQIESVGYISSK
jgi:predicted AlkP superfamily phosphohydrolase/phosphomutase